MESLDEILAEEFGDFGALGEEAEDYHPSLDEILARASDEEELDEDFFNLDDVGRTFADDDVTTIGDMSEAIDLSRTEPEIDENDFLMSIKQQANIGNNSNSDDEGTEGGSVGKTSCRAGFAEAASQKASVCGDLELSSGTDSDSDLGEPHGRDREHDLSSLGFSESGQRRVRAARERKASQGVIRVERVSEITSHLKLHRRDFGLPTAMVVRGCSSGDCQVFNTKTDTTIANLRRPNGESSSAVTALDISLVKRWLLSGQRDGGISLWDISSQTLLKEVLDVHISPVVHIHFLDDHVRVVAADTKGVVNIWSFTWSFFSYSATNMPISSGEGRQQVLAVTTLLPVTEASDSPALYQSLVALSTREGTTVFSVHPTPQVVWSTRAPPDAGAHSIPYLSFRRSGFKSREQSNTKQDKMLPPVLAIAWDRQIQLWQLVLPRKTAAQGVVGKIDFILTGSLETDTTISGLEWLGEQVIVFLNCKDELRVLDPFSLEEVESVNIKSTGLVYHTEFMSKSTGLEEPHIPGKDMLKQLAGTHAGLAYHNSVNASVSSCQMFLLGLEEVSCARILSWVDRLKALVKFEKWLEALMLALDFYEGHACAVVGLPREMLALRNLLEPHVKELMMTYMDNAISESTGIGDNTARMSSISGICIDYCISICDSSRMFGNELLGMIFQKFCGAGHGGLFLELLEPHIMSENLNTLNPAVMQAFVEHYRDRRLLDRLEDCILHMEMTYVDFHQVVTLCRKSRLWRALTYVYTKGLDDYVTPLDELLQELSRKKITTDGEVDLDDRQQLKDMAFQYLYSCLKGEQVHNQARIPALRAELSNYLFQWSGTDATKPYPQLMFKALDLMIDISISGASRWEASSDGHTQEELMLSPQTIVDILVSTMIDDLQDPFIALDSTRARITHSKTPFSPIEEGQLLFFLGKWLLRSVVSVSNDLFNRVVAYLAMGVSSSTLDVPAQERQVLLLKLLEQEHKGPDMPREYKAVELQGLCEAADFHKVCLFIYKLANNYSRAIHHYLHDDDLRPGVFDYIYGLIKDSSLPEKAQETVKSATLSHLRSLIQVDSAVTAQLIIGDFSQENSEVLHELMLYPMLQYQYLTGIINSTKQSSEMTTGLELTEQMNELYISLLCTYNPVGVYPYLISHADYRLDYCLKLCRDHKITDAEAFLLERTGDVQGALSLMLSEMDSQVVKLQAFLTAPERHKASFIQQRQHDIPDSHTNLPNDDFLSGSSIQGTQTQWIDQVHQEQLSAMDDVYSNMLFMDSGTGSDVVLELPRGTEAAELKKSVFVAINLCRRSTQIRYDDPENETLWFRLLDQFIAPMLRLKKMTKQELLSRDEAYQTGIGQTQAALTTFIRTILYNMMGQVPLPSILRKLVIENGNLEFGELRSMITSIFDAFIYEQNTLSCMSHVLTHDLYNAVQAHKHKSSQALAPRISRCAICTQGFSPVGNWRGLKIITEAGKSVTLFDCGHLFHKNCLQHTGGCPLCDSEEQKFSRRGQSGMGTNGATAAKLRGDDATRDATKRYIKRLEYAERRTKNKGSRLDLLRELHASPALPPPGGPTRNSSGMQRESSNSVSL